MFVFDGVSSLLSHPHHPPVTMSETQLVFLFSCKWVSGPIAVQSVLSSKEDFVFFVCLSDCLVGDEQSCVHMCHPNNFRISQGSRHVMSDVKAIRCSRCPCHYFDEKTQTLIYDVSEKQYAV